MVFFVWLDKLFLTVQLRNIAWTSFFFKMIYKLVTSQMITHTKNVKCHMYSRWSTRRSSNGWSFFLLFVLMCSTHGVCASRKRPSTPHRRPQLRVWSDLIPWWSWPVLVESFPLRPFTRGKVTYDKPAIPVFISILLMWRNQTLSNQN